MTPTYKGAPIRIQADFPEVLQARGKGEMACLEYWKQETDNQEYCIRQNHPSKMKEKSRISKIVIAYKKYKMEPSSWKNRMLDNKSKPYKNNKALC